MNDLKMTLKAKRTKWPLYVEQVTKGSQVSLRFALRSHVFQIIEVFYFSNGEFASFEKNSLKIRNSKFQKSQTYFCEDHWEENSGQVSKLLAAICRRSSVLKFSLPLGPMLTKTTNIRKKTNIFSKLQKMSQRMAQGKQ